MFCFAIAQQPFHKSCVLKCDELDERDTLKLTCYIQIRLISSAAVAHSHSLCGHTHCAHVASIHQIVAVIVCGTRPVSRLLCISLNSPALYATKCATKATLEAPTTPTTTSKVFSCRRHRRRKTWKPTISNHCLPATSISCGPIRKIRT